MAQPDVLTVCAGADQLKLQPRLANAHVTAFEPGSFDALLEALNDPLADEVLAGGEPNLPRVAAALPSMVGATFVGHPGVDERVLIATDGSIEGMLGPLAELGPAELTQRGQWGVLDAHLPLPLLRVDMPDGSVREQLVVARVGAEGELRVLVCRSEHRGALDRVEYLAPDCALPTDPAEFRAARR